MIHQDVEVLILAGGKGTRLASIVSDVPKPMAPVASAPFLEHLINSIKQQGFPNFRLLVGHKSEVIEKHFSDGSEFGVNIKYTREDVPLGTGGAVKKGIRESDFKKFLVFNGDTFFEADLNLFVLIAKNQNAIALKYLENCDRYGQVLIDSEYKVTDFSEKGSRKGDGYINAGIYFFAKNILEKFSDLESFSIEQLTMPLLAKERALLGVPLGGKFIDIGVPDDFNRAQTFINEFKFTNRSPALFLDRDGVIIHDTGYVSKIENVEFIPEIIPIIQKANEQNISVCIVTNQAGIARGYFTVDECANVNNYIIDYLAQNNARIDQCVICPFHPTKGIADFCVDSLLRKPHPGMILKVQENISIDIQKSIMIGDKVSDIIHLPGLRTILVQGKYNLSDAPKNSVIHQNLSETFSYLKDAFFN